MSGSRETALWNWLKGASRELRKDLHMNRVENMISRGTPDVEGHLRDRGQFWIELKSTARPAHQSTNVRFAVRDRDAQAAWLERRRYVGGQAWLLLQVGSGAKRKLYLVSGVHASEVYAGVPEIRLLELDSLWVWTEGDRPTASDVVMTATHLRP